MSTTKLESNLAQKLGERLSLSVQKNLAQQLYKLTREQTAGDDSLNMYKNMERKIWECGVLFEDINNLEPDVARVKFMTMFKTSVISEQALILKYSKETEATKETFRVSSGSTEEWVSNNLKNLLLTQHLGRQSADFSNLELTRLAVRSTIETVFKEFQIEHGWLGNGVEEFFYDFLKPALEELTEKAKNIAGNLPANLAEALNPKVEAVAEVPVINIKNDEVEKNGTNG